MDHRLAAVHADAAGDRGDRVVRDGQDDQLDLLDERLSASAKARTPATSSGTARAGRGRGWRPRGSASPPGQGHAERRPDRARPDDPDERRLAGRSSAGAGWAWSCGRAVAVVRGRGSARVEVDARLAIARRSRSVALVAASPRRRPRLSRRHGRSDGARGTLPSRRVYRPQRRMDACRSRSVRRPGQPRAGLPDLYRLRPRSPTGSTSAGPRSRVKILLENALRHAGGGMVEPGRRRDAGRRGGRASARRGRDPVHARAGPPPGLHRRPGRRRPGRRCATRWPTSAATRPLVNPLVPADLVIDHSVQVDQFGTPAAFAFNVEREYERNGERYQLLRWAQTAFRDLRVVPPGTGIVHQVNLEFLATVVAEPDADERRSDRLPGHARRDRLAHDDDQRPRRAGLRRRRDRGRGGPARPAALPADAPGRRRPPPRRAAAGLDRDRPRPRRDPDAAGATASSAPSSSSPATAWPGSPSPTGRRSAT